MPPKPRKRRRSYRYRDLAAYIRATGESYSAIGRAVGVSYVQVIRIADGAMPKPALLLRLSNYANVPPESFVYNAVARQGDPDLTAR